MFLLNDQPKTTKRKIPSEEEDEPTRRLGQPKSLEWSDVTVSRRIHLRGKSVAHRVMRARRNCRILPKRVTTFRIDAMTTKHAVWKPFARFSVVGRTNFLGNPISDSEGSPSLSRSRRTTTPSFLGSRSGLSESADTDDLVCPASPDVGYPQPILMSQTELSNPVSLI